MTTDIIAACVLGLWIALGFALHKYFEWQRWDEDRRIERVRYVTAYRASFEHSVPVRVVDWMNERPTSAVPLYSVKV